MNLFGYNKEQHLLRLFEQGNAFAMDQLYGEYADYLAAVCARYIPNVEDMHDVLQEAFIRIFTKIHTFEYQGKGSLKAWLTRVVVNEALYFLRKDHSKLFVNQAIELPDAEIDAPDVDSLSVTQITNAIQQLPLGYRTVFNLFAIEGKTHKEIAALLHIKPNTSASQFHKARNLLTNILNEQKQKETEQ